MSDPTQTIPGIHLWLLLSKASQAMEVHARRSVAEQGLCLSDFAVLEALLHKGPLAVNVLGKKVLLTSGSITTAVDRLQERGWVERRAEEGDRRARVVGRGAIRKLFAAHERDMEQAVAFMSARERVVLANGLRRLGRGAAVGNQESGDNDNE
jgi:MarR family transcriptional regulator, 2-MHQ and catechol-resistance regulon repressor